MDNTVFKNTVGVCDVAHKNLFNDIISLENLFTSWDEFKKGKENKKDVQKFVLDLEDNLFALHQELKDGSYHHGLYQSFYIKDPKLRHIHKAFVRDRVVHHAVVRILEPIFDPVFIFDSYSSRKDKGAHKAIQRFRRFAWKLSQNNTKTVWVLHLDIKKYFDSINHDILFELIQKKVNDKKTTLLIKNILESFGKPRERERERESTKGIPLGNVTSQLFANIYLNELDQFVKRGLRIKNYLRYADDFVLITNNEDYLKKQIKPISYFLLQNLKLQLHPNKIILKRWGEGVDFLGYIIFPHFTLLRAKTRKRMFKKIEQKKSLLNQDKASLKTFRQTVMSYMGICSHARTRFIQKELKTIYQREYRKNWKRGLKKRNSTPLKFSQGCNKKYCIF